MTNGDYTGSMTEARDEFRVGDVLYSICLDWEHANPMTVIGFASYGDRHYQYDIVCVGKDGKIYEECPEAWLKQERSEE